MIFDQEQWVKKKRESTSSTYAISVPIEHQPCEHFINRTIEARVDDERSKRTESNEEWLVGFLMAAR